MRKSPRRYPKPKIWASCTAHIELRSGRRLSGVVREHNLNGVELATGEGVLYVELWEIDNMHCC